MGLLDFLRPRPARLALDTPMPAAPVKRAADAQPIASMAGSLSYNLQTGAGTERDPLEWEWLKAWFLVPDRSQLEAVIRQSGIARKLVTLPATWCTLQGEQSWSIKDKSPAAAPLEQAMRRLRTAAHLAEADRAACELGNAATWIQAEEGGAFSLSNQSVPIDRARLTGVRALQTIRKYEMTPIAWQQRIGERIPVGEPILYRVQIQRPGMSLQPFDLHASRLILWRGAPCEPMPSIPASYGWGDDSVLLSALAAIQSVGRARRALDRAADTYRMLIAYTGLPPAGTPDEMHAAIRANWAEIRKMTAMGVFVADKGDGVIPPDRLEQLDAPLTGLVGLSPEALKALAAETPIPLPLLTGEFAGSLGGEDGQLGGWYGYIGTRRATVYEPAIMALADLLYAAAGVYQPAYTVSFAPVAYQDAVKVAEARLKRIQGDQILVDIGAITPEQVFRSRAQEGDQPELQPALPEETPTGEPPATDAETYTIPKGAQGNARRVLRWREEHPNEIRGMTSTGWARARQLARGGSISEQDIREIRAWFARHGAQKATRAVAPELKDEPWRDAGYVSWLGWGGDTMRSYVEGLRADAIDRVLVALEVDPASVAMIGAQVRAVLPDLDPEPWPHVTLHYLGDGLPDRALPAVERKALESGPWPATIEGDYVAPLGDEGAIVLHLRRRGLEGTQARLMRSLAVETRAEQYPRFLPHVTLGYVGRALTDAEIEALAELSADVKTTALTLRSGGREIVRRSL